MRSLVVGPCHPTTQEERGPIVILLDLRFDPLMSHSIRGQYRDSVVLEGRARNGTVKLLTR